ncbi:kinesin family member 25 [Octopus vulgaris]|uniref:Kinesin family member 25 n=1 Tax=Octopus vulgaris TaxID=6645 RepID=A0AA36ATP1_OCTVU|nr:kinesin family member 25 [Octopus vulgaris]
MLGSHKNENYNLSHEAHPDEGVIPRAMRELFSLMSEKPTGTYQAEVSVVEIYNNDIRDLLSKDFKSFHANMPDLKTVKQTRNIFDNSCEDNETGEEDRHYSRVKQTYRSRLSLLAFHCDSNHKFVNIFFLTLKTDLTPYSSEAVFDMHI